MPCLREIAAALRAEFAGDGDFVVRSINHPAAAGPDDLALAMEPDALAALAGSRARAAVLRRGSVAPAGLAGALHVEYPRYALGTLTRLFAERPHLPAGVHPTAVVDPTAEIIPPTAIGPFVQIGAGAYVGPGTTILGQVSIGAGARIGADALIYPGVRIGERVRIGHRVILHNNASIGADGFSFAIPDPGGRPPAGEPPISRIASLGTVVLGDDVEVGANTCIDRGTIEATTVGNGTKIDNLVMIGHNNKIGENCLIAGRVGISGSCRIGDRVILAGGVGIADHVVIGDGAVILAGSQVGSSRIAGGAVMLGIPAVVRERFFEQLRLQYRLKQLFADVAELKTRLKPVRKDAGGG
jgi:UDP-3-O-[3-hydroxymyristoyl] glucosamine N-acyltransferase